MEKQTGIRPSVKNWGLLCFGWLVVWAVMAWPVITGEHQYYIRDLTFYALPMKTFMMSRLGSGHIPFWTPHLSAGMPFLAEASHQVLYPGNIVFWLTPSIVQGISWFVLLHQLFCMPAFYALGRAVRLSRMVSFWASVVFLLSGYVVSISDNVNYLPATVWAPLGLAGIVYSTRHLSTGVSALLRFKSWLLTALSLSMMLLAGDLINPMFITLCMLGLAVYHTLQYLNASEETDKRLWPIWAWIGTTLGLTVLLAGAQLLPTLELSALSSRSAPLDLSEVTLWSFPPQRLIELLTPFFYGSKYPTGLGTEMLGWATAVRGPHFLGMFLYPEFREPWADSVYLGLIPIALALFALTQWRRFLPAQRIWLGVCIGLVVGSLALAFGHFVPYTPMLLKLVPIFQFHRYPEKYIFWTTFGLCWLGAMGADRLRAMLADSPPVKKLPLWLTLGALIGLPWLLIACLVEWPAGAWIWTHAMERSVEWGPHYYDRLLHLDGLRAHGFWLGFLTLLGVLGLLSNKRLGRKQVPLKQVALSGLLVLGLVDLGLAHWRHTPTAPTSLLLHPANEPVAFDWAQIRKAVNIPLTPSLPEREKASRKIPATRIYYDDVISYVESPNIQRFLDQIAEATHSPPISDQYDIYWMYRVLYNQQRLLFNYGTILGMSYLNGRFAPLQPLAHKHWDTIMQQVSPLKMMVDSGTQFVITSVQPHNPMWDDPKEYEVLASSNDLNVRVVKVLHDLPRAYLASYALVNNDPMVYKLLTDGFTDPLHQVELADPQGMLPVQQPVPTSSPQPARISWITDSPEQMTLKVSSGLGHIGYLVVNEGLFPGWQARVDGRPCPLLLANKRFMALPLAPGSHWVELSYHSTYWIWGCVFSTLGVLVLVACCFLQIDETEKAPSTDSS